MRILTHKEVREAEHEAIGRSGMSTPVIVNRAGVAVVQFCTSHFKFRSVCVLCGRDRGEGLAAASAFSDLGLEVAVIVLVRGPNELTEDAVSFCSRLGEAPMWIESEADF